jgi:hypothetical protein
LKAPFEALFSTGAVPKEVFELVGAGWEEVAPNEKGFEGVEELKSIPDGASGCEAPNENMLPPEFCC